MKTASENYCIIFVMKNILKKILYYMLSIQEKTLSIKLGKSLKTSYTNKTSKTILSSTEHMTLTLQTEKNKDTVKKNVEDIVKNCQNNPQKLLEYIIAAGTKVYKLNNADKILAAIGEDEGLICELKGLKALYLNLFTTSKFSLTFQPAFVMREGNIEPLYMLHQFYKWYSLKMNLPGFDYKAQENFKKYLKNVNDKTLNNLSMEDTLALTEAVARDQEATAFALSFAQKTEGAKNVRKKMTEGGADI